MRHCKFKPQSHGGLRIHKDGQFGYSNHYHLLDEIVIWRMAPLVAIYAFDIVAHSVRLKLGRWAQSFRFGLKSESEGQRVAL